LHFVSCRLFLLLHSVPNALFLLFSRSPSPRLRSSSWPSALSLLPSHHQLTSTRQNPNRPSLFYPVYSTIGMSFSSN
jgi:hypothetical protein